MNVKLQLLLEVEDGAVESEPSQTEEAVMRKKNHLRQSEDFDSEEGDLLLVLEEECMSTTLLPMYVHRVHACVQSLV